MLLCFERAHGGLLVFPAVSSVGVVHREGEQANNNSNRILRILQISSDETNPFCATLSPLFTTHRFQVGQGYLEACYHEIAILRSIVSLDLVKAN